MRRRGSRPTRTATGELQAALLERVERSPYDDSIRVVRLGGAQLLASTHPAERAGDLPRRLTRDEKWLFDLGQELRAAADTNQAEGVFRKPQIDVSRVGQRAHPGHACRTSRTAPIAGFVQHDRPLEAVAPARAPLPWPLLVVLPVALLWLVALALNRSGGAATGATRWILFLVALGLFSAAWYLYSSRALAGLEAYRRRRQRLGRRRLPGTSGARAEVKRRTPARSIPGTWTSSSGRAACSRPTAASNAEATDAAIESFRRPFVRALWGNWALGAVILAFFALGAARKLRETLSEYRYAYMYVTPAMVGMLILVFFPFIYGITLSFTGQTIFNTNQPLTELCVGLQNYVDILGDFDVAKRTAEGWVINYQNFYWTLFITICWTVSNVAVGVGLGMVLALMLNTPGLRFKAIYRVLLILPWAIPNYITALIWKALFHQQFGAINQAIQMFGGEPVAWFDGVFSSFITGLATNGWLSFPFMMVVILGGLQSISADMYEAATVEGATRRQQFWSITLPLAQAHAGAGGDPVGGVDLQHVQRHLPGLGRRAGRRQRDPDHQGVQDRLRSSTGTPTRRRTRR